VIRFNPWPRRRCGWFVPVAVALVLMAGCATGPRPVPDERTRAWAELRGELEALDQWQAEGRIVVRDGGDGTPAGFTWIEHPDGGFQLRLSGPWGQGVARLTGGAGRAELVTAEGARYTAVDAHQLLSDVYGWDIPVAGLRRWLLGLPGPDAEHTLDRFGRLETLDWHDWRIKYGRYRLVENGLDMPAVLTAAKAGGDTEVRVAIHEWRLGSNKPDAPTRGSPIPLMGSAR
jgi:outer membrane lipoprotein LolB